MHSTALPRAMQAIDRLATQTLLPHTSQVVVLDKLDYCASLHNLDSVKDCSNFKVRPAVSAAEGWL